MAVPTVPVWLPGPATVTVLPPPVPDPVVAMAKMCNAGLPDAAGLPAGSCTEAIVLPAARGTVSEKMSLLWLALVLPGRFWEAVPTASVLPLAGVVDHQSAELSV